MKLVVLRKMGTKGEWRIRECCHSSFSKESILSCYCQKHGPLMVVRTAEGLFTGQIACPITCQVSGFPLSLSSVRLIYAHFRVPLANLTTGVWIRDTATSLCPVLSAIVSIGENGKRKKKRKNSLSYSVSPTLHFFWQIQFESLWFGCVLGCTFCKLSSASEPQLSCLPHLASFASILV